MEKHRILAALIIFLLPVAVFSADNDLGKALSEKDIVKAEELLLSGADVDAEYEWKAPIKIAMDEGEYDFAAKLIDAGADIRDMSLLGQAIDVGEMELAQKLLDAGADIDIEYEWEAPIKIAMNDDEYDFAAKLLDAGADIRDMSLLGQAISEGEMDFAQKLLDSGADIDINYNWEAPIEIAMDEGEYDFAAKLIDAGADIHDMSLLAKAIQAGAVDFAMKLLDAGVDPEETYYGATPLSLAEAIGDNNLINKIESVLK